MSVYMDQVTVYGTNGDILYRMHELLAGAAT